MADDRTAPDASVLRRAFDWMFSNRLTGEITIFQFPNVALWAFIVASVARRFIDGSTTAATVLGGIATIATLVWAGDELLRGVNPWRRMIGVAVLAAQLAALIFR